MNNEGGMESKEMRVREIDDKEMDLGVPFYEFSEAPFSEMLVDNFPAEVLDQSVSSVVSAIKSFAYPPEENKRDIIINTLGEYNPTPRSHARQLNEFMNMSEKGQEMFASLLMEGQLRNRVFDYMYGGLLNTDDIDEVKENLTEIHTDPSIDSWMQLDEKVQEEDVRRMKRFLSTRANEAPLSTVISQLTLGETQIRMLRQRDIRLYNYRLKVGALMLLAGTTYAGIRLYTNQTQPSALPTSSASNIRNQVFPLRFPESSLPSDMFFNQTQVELVKAYRRTYAKQLEEDMSKSFLYGQMYNTETALPPNLATDAASQVWYQNWFVDYLQNLPTVGYKTAHLSTSFYWTAFRTTGLTVLGLLSLAFGLSGQMIPSAVTATLTASAVLTGADTAVTNAIVKPSVASVWNAIESGFKHIHPKNQRQLVKEEADKLDTLRANWDDSMRDGFKYSLIGNAISNLWNHERYSDMNTIYKNIVHFYINRYNGPLRSLTLNNYDRNLLWVSLCLPRSISTSIFKESEVDIYSYFDPSVGNVLNRLRKAIPIEKYFHINGIQPTDWKLIHLFASDTYQEIYPTIPFFIGQESKVKRYNNSVTTLHEIAFNIVYAGKEEEKDFYAELSEFTDAFMKDVTLETQSTFESTYLSDRLDARVFWDALAKDVKIFE